jgi:hypothetical protein
MRNIFGIEWAQTHGVLEKDRDAGFTAQPIAQWVQGPF